MNCRQELLAIQDKPGDDLYAWFEVMCRFCAGKPLAYQSRYFARLIASGP